jgi:uncharacterized protein YkwD
VPPARPVLRLAAAVLTGAALAATSTIPADAGGPRPYETEVVGAANAARVRAVAPALRRSACLDRYAARQAQRMASEDRLRHQDLAAVLTGCGLRSAGENVGYGYRDGVAVTRAWLLSPDHRANLLDPGHRLVGVGARRAADGSWYVSEVLGRVV